MSVTHGQCDVGPSLPSQPQGITACLAVTKLYCLVTEARVCVNNLSRVAVYSGAAGIRTRGLLIANPALETSDVTIS